MSTYANFASNSGQPKSIFMPLTFQHLLTCYLCKWRFTVLFVALLFIPNASWAQNENNAVRIDSLRQLLKNYSGLDSNKVDVLNQLGFEYWIVDPNESEVLSIEALELAKLLNYKQGIAFANRVIGVAHWVRGNPDLSFRYLLDAEKVYRSIGDSLGLANSMLNLGMVYADRQNHSTSLEKYKESLSLFQSLGKSSRIATTYTKTAEVLIAQEDYNQAYKYLTEALAIHQKEGFLYGISEVDSKLGKLSIARGEYREAISYLLLSVEAGKQRNDHVGAADAYHDIAQCHYLLGELKQAERYLLQSEELAEKFSLKKVQRDVYYTAKEIAVERGLYERAVGYYDKYMLVKDSLFNEEKSNMIASMESQRTYDEQERELAMAQQNLDLLLAERQRDRLMVLALIMALLAFGAFGWGMLQRKNRLLVQRDVDLKKAQTLSEELHTLVADKDRELTSYTLNFVQKNELINNLKDSLNKLKKALQGQHRSQLDALSRQLNEAFKIDEDWEDFRRHFESVHPDLILRLNKAFPSLTKNEFRLIALLRLNLSSKEISAVLGISPDSVKTARYRLRKKLGLQNQEELFDFLLRFES